MPRNRRPSTPLRPPAGPPLNARREITLAIALPLTAIALTAIVLSLHLFLADPLPWWGKALSVAALASPVVAAIILCFRGRSRQNWKASLAFPILIAVGSGALVPAFNQFALAHHGIDVECSVFSRYDYMAEVEGEDEPRSEHEFLCVGWEPPTLTTDRDEALEVGDHRIIVFDALGRVDPTFGDPSTAGGLVYLPLTGLFALAAAAIRLFLVYDGTFTSRGRRRNRAA